jgi:hypothetical protein
MAADAARVAYVKLVMELDPGWKPEHSSVPAAALSSSSSAASAAPAERKQSWVVFSSMQAARCVSPKLQLTPRSRPSFFTSATATAAATPASGKAYHLPPPACPSHSAAALLSQATQLPFAPCWPPAPMSILAMKISRPCQAPFSRALPAVRLIPAHSSLSQAAHRLRPRALALGADAAVSRCRSECRCS